MWCSPRPRAAVLLPLLALIVLVGAARAADVLACDPSDPTAEGCSSGAAATTSDGPVSSVRLLGEGEDGPPETTPVDGKSATALRLGAKNFWAVSDNDREFGGIRVFEASATSHPKQVAHIRAGACKVLDVLPLKGAPFSALLVAHLRNTDLVVWEVKLDAASGGVEIQERSRRRTYTIPSAGAAFSDGSTGLQYFFSAEKTGDIHQWRVNVLASARADQLLLVRTVRAHPVWTASNERVAIKSLVCDEGNRQVLVGLKGGEVRVLDAVEKPGSTGGGTRVHRLKPGSGMAVLQRNEHEGVIFATGQSKGSKNALHVFSRGPVGAHTLLAKVPLSIPVAAKNSEIELEGLTVDGDSLVAHVEFKSVESGFKSSVYAVFPLDNVLARILPDRTAVDDFLAEAGSEHERRRAHIQELPRVLDLESFNGNSCEEPVCTRCVHGECVGPNVCQCDEQHRGQRCDHAIVRPSHQTAPAGKDADDPAIWVHPTEPSKSIILGTTKSDRDSGIHSFALDGTHLSFLSGGEPNSVDVMYGFPFGGKNIDIAVAGGRESNTVRVAAIGEDGKLTLLNGGEFDAGIVVYGSGVYHSKKTGAYFVFMNSKKGEVRQFQIFEKEGSAGTLDNLLIKSFKLDSQIEGMVADDDLGYVYVGEEKVGLWRYPAEPNAFDEPVLVDHTNRANGGNMSADIEGVSLFVGKGKTGYIVTSNQGEDSYTLHKRAPPHRFVGSFVIAANDDKGIDGVSHTDGLVVESSRLGPLYPEGALVVHDDETTSPDGTESEATFKIVSWRDIADSVSSKALATFPGRDPRR